MFACMQSLFLRVAVVSHTLQEFLVLTRTCRIKSAIHREQFIIVMHDFVLHHDHHTEESRILVAVCSIYCRRYGNSKIEVYFLVVKSMRVSKILFLTFKNKLHMPLCTISFFCYYLDKLFQHVKQPGKKLKSASSIHVVSLVRIWKVFYLGPRCSFV